MAVPYPTLSKYWLGRRRLPATLVEPLFAATDEDERVADFFLLGGSLFRLEREPERQPIESVSQSVLILASLEGRVAELYLEAKNDSTQKQTSNEELDKALKNLSNLADRMRASI